MLFMKKKPTKADRRRNKKKKEEKHEWPETTSCTAGNLANTYDASTADPVWVAFYANEKR